MATIVTNGTIITGGASSRVIADAAIAWDGDRICSIDRLQSIRDRFPDANILDAHGGLILPGFINLHHHFYSALARGLDPGVEMGTFGDVLEGLWWRLDRALDRPAVRLSARLTAADCIRAGCTTVFDHHASPSCIAGSLDVLASEIAAAGLSAVLCYEISDRNGHDEAIAGIEENADFCARHVGDPRIRGTMGLHASFTLADETLDATAELSPEGAGCHIHVAEDPIDVRVSSALYGADPITRLDRSGLLTDRALLAHGVHLEDKDFERIAKARSILINNPESNANNGVGRLDAAGALRAGCRVGLGTDGMASSMLRSLRAFFLAQSAAAVDTSVGFQTCSEMWATNSGIAARFFDEPLLGEFSVGAPADIAVVDAPPPTQISSENLFGHLIYGASEAPVRHTIARGRVLMEDFQLVSIDIEETAREAREVAPGVWNRFRLLIPPQT